MWNRTRATGSISDVPMTTCRTLKNSTSGDLNFSKMNDAILVTGASGFIGGHLVPALESAGHRVYCHSLRQGNIASCPLEYEDVAHVFHLAGKTFVPESWEEPRGFYEVNVLGAANVLEFCRRRRASLTL